MDELLEEIRAGRFDPIYVLHSEHPVLIEVATTIADGMPVDWESLRTAHPEFSEELEGLRVLQELEAARRRAAEEKGGPR